MIKKSYKITQRPAFHFRIDKKLINIDCQNPFFHAISAQQVIIPVDTTAGCRISLLGRPKRAVRLIQNKLSGSVGGTVINHKKVTDAQLSIIVQKERQSDATVANHEHQNEIVTFYRVELQSL